MSDRRTVGAAVVRRSPRLTARKQLLFGSVIGEHDKSVAQRAGRATERPLRARLSLPAPQYADAPMATATPLITKLLLLRLSPARPVIIKQRPRKPAQGALTSAARQPAPRFGGRRARLRPISTVAPSGQPRCYRQPVVNLTARPPRRARDAVGATQPVSGACRRRRLAAQRPQPTRPRPHAPQRARPPRITKPPSRAPVDGVPERDAADVRANGAAPPRAARDAAEPAYETRVGGAVPQIETKREQTAHRPAVGCGASPRAPRLSNTPPLFTPPI